VTPMADTPPLSAIREKRLDGFGRSLEVRSIDVRKPGWLSVLGGWIAMVSRLE